MFLTAKYKGSVLGIAWSLANPLLLMGIYLLVFSVLWKAVGNIDHYPIYLLSGLAVWVFLSTSLQAAARSMLDSAELIKKVRFTRQLVTFSVVATNLVAFGVMLAVLIVVGVAALPRTRAGDVVYLAVAAIAALALGAFVFSRVDDRIAVEL